MNSQLQIDPIELEAFCQKWQIREFALFGSALRDDFGPESDIDILVSFDPLAKWDLFHIVEMKDELAQRYGRPIDIVEKEALRNPWRKDEIMRTRKVLYAA